MLVLFGLIGCTTVNIPNYIKDDHPYTHLVYADFNAAIEATTQALADSGWVVIDQSDPTVFEHSSIQHEGGRETLLFTDIKERSFFLGTRYSRINVYLRSTSQPNETELELRFIAISSLTFAEMKKYKNPRAAAKIIEDIEKHLK